MEQDEQVDDYQVSVKAAAAELAIGKDGVWALIKRRELLTRNYGARQTRISRSSLDAYKRDPQRAQ